MFVRYTDLHEGWLLSKGRVDQAWKIVREFHRTSRDIDDSYARAEFTQMQKQIEMDSKLDSSWRILVTRPSYRKRALIACAVLTFLYSSGTLTVSSMLQTTLEPASNH